MKPTSQMLRRGLLAAVGAAVAGAGALTVLPSAAAAPDPCEASTVARTIGTVATNTGSYLDANPDTNEALTAISQQQAGPQALGTLKAYFDANPEVAEDMQRLQQPLVVLSSRCQLPVTLPQLMGLMQAAQSQAGALPRGLPGAAQAVGLPAAAVPAQSSGASAVIEGVGPLPGPRTSGTR